MGNPFANIIGLFRVLASSGLGVVRAFVSFLGNLVSFVISNIPLIVVLALLIGFGFVWTQGGNDDVVEGIEFGWRCIVYPFLEPLLQLLDPLADLSDSIVCWLNSFGLFNGLIGQRLLTGVLRECYAFSYQSFLKQLAITGKALSDALRWILDGIGNSPFPSYPVTTELLKTVGQLGDVITCLCGNLGLVGDIVTRIIESNELACAIHHLVNSLIYSTQANLGWGYEVLVNFASILAGNPDGFQALADALVSGTGPFAMASVFPTTERWAAATASTAQFGNHVVGAIACSIVGAVETGGFQPEYAQLAYDACMTPRGSLERNTTCALWIAEDPGASLNTCIDRATVRINLFGWIGALGEAIFRLLGALYQFGSRIGQVITEFITLPAGPRFVLDEWQLDAFWDTLRVPPPELGGPAASKLNIVTNTLVYGNLTQLEIQETCNSTNLTASADPLGCEECKVRPRSLEEHWCELWRQVDDAVEPVFTIRPFEPILCCLPVSILRVVVGFGKWILDVGVHYLAGVDQLAVYVASTSRWSVPWTELAGPPTSIGGLLKCICDLFALDPNDNLRCVCILIVNPIKSVVEAVRAILLLVPALANSILEAAGSGLFNVGEPTLVSQLCLDGSPFCFDLEGRILKWWRQPRDRTTLFQNITVNSDNGTVPILDYLPLNTTGSPITTLVSNNTNLLDNVFFIPSTQEVWVGFTFGSATINEYLVGNTIQAFDPPLVLNSTTFMALNPEILGNGATVIANETWIITVRRTQVNFTFVQIEIDVSRVPEEENWLECLCFILSVEFVNQYLDTPIDGDVLPDICCVIRYSVRLVVELVKLVMEFIFGLVQTVVELAASSGDGLVLLRWLACDGESGLCSPLPEAISDLQDLLSCPCLLIDSIEINGKSIPCLCKAINSFIIGLIELLRFLIAIGKAALETARCVFIAPPIPPITPDPQCNTILIQRFIIAFEIILSSMEYFSDAFGNLGCVIGLLVPFGCLDRPGFTPCVFASSQYSIDTCDAPTAYPIPGMNYPSYGPNPECQCSPLLRFKRLFESLFDTVALLIIIPVNTVIDFLAVLQGLNNMDFTSNIALFLLNLIHETVIRIGYALVGNPNASDTEAFGVLQNLGLVINCALGPTNCGVSNQLCVGDLLIELGNWIQGILACLIGTLVFDEPTGGLLFIPFRIVFDVLFAGAANIGNLIPEFFDAVFCLLDVVFEILGDSLLTFTEQLIVSLLVLIFGEGARDAIETIVGLIFDGFEVIVDIIEALFCFFTGGDFFVCFDLDVFEPGIGVGPPLKRQKSPPTFENHDKWEKLKGHLLSPPDFYKMIQHPDQYAQERMVPGSFCAKVFARHAAPGYQSTPEEQLTYQLCQASIIVPHLVNRNLIQKGSSSAHGPFASLRRQWNDNKKLPPLIPLDLLSNTTRFGEYIKDAKPILSAFRQWIQGRANGIRPDAGHTFFARDEVDPDAPRVCEPGDDRHACQMAPNTQIVTRYYNYTLQAFFEQRGLANRPLAQDMVAWMPYWNQASNEKLAGSLISTVYHLTKDIDAKALKRSFNEAILGMRRRTWQQVVESIPEQQRKLPPSVPHHQENTTSVLAVVPLHRRSMWSIAQEVMANMWNRHYVNHPWREHVRMEAITDALLAWHQAHKTQALEQQLGGLVAMHKRLATVTGSESFLERSRQLEHWWQGHLITLHPNDDDDDGPKRQFVSPWPRCNTTAPGEPCFDCAVLDRFLNETVEIFSYCVDRADGLIPPINFEPTGDIGIHLVPLNTTTSFFTGSGIFVDAANTIFNFFNGIVGFDVVATAFNLIKNTNTDPNEGPVGIYAFIPYVTRCDRELHLQCSYGLGIGPALLITLCVVVLLPLVLSFVFSPLSTFIMTVVAIVGFWRIFFGFFAFLAWGYNPTCLDLTGGSVLAALLPFRFVWPGIPECAVRQLKDFAETYIVPCLFTILPPILQAAVREGTVLCPKCVTLIDLYDCANEFGFDSPTDGIGYLLSMGSGFIISPVVGQWLQSTCLVRGGCLWGGQVPGEDTGILAGLFGGGPSGIPLPNATGILNQTQAELTLDYCAATMSLAGFGTLALGAVLGILFFYLIPVFVAIVQFFWDGYLWYMDALTSSQPEPMENAELPPVPDGLILDELEEQEARIRRLESTQANQATG